MAEICQRITCGESLRRILKGEGMPSLSVFYDWLDEDSEEGRSFTEQYACARVRQADTFADMMNDIAEDGTNDWMASDEGYKVNGEAIQRSKLRIDTLKWQAAKLRPKKYGERIEQAIEQTVEVKHSLEAPKLVELAAALRNAPVKLIEAQYSEVPPEDGSDLV